MINDTAKSRMANRNSSSFAANLQTWSNIMDAYTGGGHAYHATMPTDALKDFRNTIIETEEYGFDKLKSAQQQLGNKVRAMLAGRGIKSVGLFGLDKLYDVDATVARLEAALDAVT